jgi:ribonuclease HI
MLRGKLYSTLANHHSHASTNDPSHSWLHFLNPKQFLLFTDGACLNNGGPNPTAGWAFVHGPGSPATSGGKPLVMSGRLERKGPFGEDSIQSSNRAELRAVIAALRFRHWVGEGFTSVVIATDSEYVVEGATEWAKKWIANGWKTSGKVDVKNKDLWELLLGEVEGWKEKGLEVMLWRVPRECNEVADGEAKKAAGEEEFVEWVDALGVNF